MTAAAMAIMTTVNTRVFFTQSPRTRWWSAAVRGVYSPRQSVNPQSLREEDIVGKTRGIILTVGCLVISAMASAQGTAGGGIAGVARDTSGAVLPGVTVEATS